MILQTKQTFDQVMLDRTNSSEFLKFVAQHAEQELVSKLIDELQDHEFHIVQLGEPWTETDDRWCQATYRQLLREDTIVCCKDCIHRMEGRRFCIGRHDDFFCADGKRRNE